MLKSLQTFSQKALGGFSYAVPVIVGVVIMGSLNSTMFTTSRFFNLTQSFAGILWKFVFCRYFYAAARQGHMPSFMKLLHVTQHTPQASLVTYVNF